MRRRLFLFSTIVAVASSITGLTLLVNDSTATALDVATPTPLLLPTKVIPKHPPTITFTTEDGEIVEAEVMIREGEPPSSEMGELVAETDHLRFHTKNGYLPVDLESFTREAEDVFDYVSARLETTMDIKPLILFQRPDRGPCPTRGMTSYTFDDSTPPMVIISADEQTSHAQVMGVLAHELGHALQNAGRGRQWDSAHIALREGGATWAAGRYWDAWQGASFDDLVRAYLTDATYLPLYEDLDLSLAYAGENCIEKRDILYTEWAAFIDFLLTTYDMDQLEDLFRSSPPEETEIDGEEAVIYHSADFEGVYGLALNQLEAAWLDHLTN